MFGKMLSMAIEDNKNVYISSMNYYILGNMLRNAGLGANGPS